ncbi:asparagine synthase-related protein [Candidatus Omnitrophota bacterium]
MNLPELKNKYTIAGRVLLDGKESKPIQQIPFTAEYCQSCVAVRSSRPARITDNHSVIILGDILDIKADGAYFESSRNNLEELVAQLFVKEGKGFCSLLDGFFIIVIHDRTSGEVFIFNSRHQATQLYYCANDNALFFASSLKLLLDLLPYTPPFDKQALPSFLRTGFSYTEKTQLEGVKKLLPTQFIHVHDKTYTVSDHWKTEYIFDRRPFTDLNAKLDEYESVYSKSIGSFLNCVKPGELGCFLSGGHDTSFTFIQTSKLFGKPVHAFTASYENFAFDETPKARYITEKFGGVHHPVVIGPDAIDCVPYFINIVEEPVSGGALPIFMCILEARKHVDSMISGDAGDTLWGEYYPVAEWHRYFRRLPYILRKGARLLNKIILSVNDWERFWESDHVFSLFAEKNIYDDFFGRLCSYRHYNIETVRKILDAETFKEISLHKCMIDLPFTKDNFFDALIETKMLYGVYQYMLPPTQKPIEGFGMNYYSPYLNNKLITFINSLPKEWLNDGTTFQKLSNTGHRRRFHKMAMLRYLPEQYVYSAQQSCDVPFHLFLTKRPIVLERLLSRLKRRGLFNNRSLEHIFNEFPRQKIKPREIIELKHHGYRIFCLLTFEIWCMQFIDTDKEKNAPTQKTVPLEDYLQL